jgi:membrane associated rhomboid family serine protease
MIPLRDDQPIFSTPFVNYFLIVVNVLVFVWQSLIEVQNPQALRAFVLEFGVVPHHAVAILTGHSHDPAVAAILPLFTSMFLHASILHVAGNMLFLWIFGDNVEDYLGHFTYLVFYLMSGVAAAVTHILLNQASRAPTVGASGAIAGVMGAYFILYPRARVLVWFPPIFLFHVPAWLMLGYWFVINFLSGTSTALSQTSQSSNGIAFWAHIGGFVAGVVMINLFRERPHRYRYGTW